jgi:hypothetical protein
MPEVIGFMVVATGCASLLIAVGTWARERLRGDGSGTHAKEYVDQRLMDLAEQHERELSEVEERYDHKIVELEERLDFAERLFTRRRTGEPALPADRSPTPT